MKIRQFRIAQLKHAPVRVERLFFASFSPVYCSHLVGWRLRLRSEWKLCLFWRYARILRYSCKVIGEHLVHYG